MEPGTELAHRNESAVAPREGGIPMEQRMAMLREALTNPEVDPTKAVAMADLMFKLEDRDRQAEFNRDLIAAKRAMPAIFKRGSNDHQHTKYAKFEDMQRAVDPVLAQHRLSIDFRIGNDGPNITVVPVLRHENGWIEEGGAMKGLPDKGPGRSDIQAVGSASSYLKRYAMVATLNLVLDGEDNDGAGIGRDDYKLNDRQSGLVVDAQAAAERNEYGKWYAALKPADKAFLVTSGTHARFGGAALPGPTTTRQPEPEQERPTPPPPPESGTGITPEGWADKYVAHMDAAKTEDAVVQIKTRGARTMAGLSESHPKLWEKCDAAELAARDRLASGTLV